MAQKILLNVSGKNAIEVESAEKDISFFKLDLDNPRFNHAPLSSEKAIENEIWNEKDIGVLYNSILESKGISEPIFTKPNGIVIEGNRRVVCLRKIKEKYASNENLFPKNGYEKIPTYIVPLNTDPTDIDVLLARWHVTGKKEWKSLNQAEHIYNLYTKRGLTIEQIKNLIGMSKGKIHQKLWAFSETKNFLKQHPKESIDRYSFFEEAYKKKNIKEFVEDSKERFEFHKWIVDNKFNLTGAKDIRYLSLILNNKELMKTFQKQGIKEAYFNYQKDPEKSDKEFEVILEAHKLLRNLNAHGNKTILEDNAKIDLLSKLKEEIDKILRG